MVYVSLDEDWSDFERSSFAYPFISFSNHKGWETPAAKDYHVFATSTMFLLDQNRKILLWLHSVKQVDARVDWLLVNEHR